MIEIRVYCNNDYYAVWRIEAYTRLTSSHHHYNLYLYICSITALTTAYFFRNTECLLCLHICLCVCLLVCNYEKASRKVAYFYATLAMVPLFQYKYPHAAKYVYVYLTS